FDFRADAGTQVFEMGDSAPLGAQLTVESPAIPPKSTLRVRILRAAEGGAVEVASGDGKTPLHFVADTAGAYRAEVHMTPNHLNTFMKGSVDDLLHEMVWIYSNAIYVSNPQ